MRFEKLPTLRLAPRRSSGRATVSVVITCYNYAHFLPQAVGSVLGQEGVDVDVIVVDDASTDASLATASSLASRDARVKVLANDVNAGPVSTFNKGLAQARGEFLVRLDADDLLTPGSLERAVALMQAHPNVGMVYGHPLHFSGDTLPEARTEPKGWLVWSGADWLAARCGNGDNVITSPEVVMRRSVVDLVGGQRALPHLHDMEMWLRLSARTDVGYVIGVDQAWHREHSASLSTTVGDTVSALSEALAAFEMLCRGLEPPEVAAEVLLPRARRAVAVSALASALNAVDRGEASRQVLLLQELAVETDPLIVSSPLWRSVERRLSYPPRIAKVRGLVPRARARWGVEVRRRRWERTGVYERLRLITLEGAA